MPLREIKHGLCREHKHVAQDTAVCRSPHTSSNSHSHITTQFGHKYTFCQNVVPTNNCFSLYFRKNITCFSVGPLRICPFPSVCCQTVYRCVTTYCCFMKDISQCATCFGLMWAIIRKNHSYKRRIWHWYVSSCVHQKYTIKIRYMKDVFKLGVWNCDIIINIKDWTLWSVPFPELQLLSPTFLRSSNCSPSL